MLRAHEVQKALEGLWSTKDVMRYFGVTATTVHLWRKYKGMPFFSMKGPRGTVGFVPEEVKQWGRDHSMRIRDHSSTPRVRPLNGHERVRPL